MITYLGLKKINEVIPEEQFHLLCQTFDHLNKDGFEITNKSIIKILDHVKDKLDKEVCSKINYSFFEWSNKMLDTKLFHKIKQLVHNRHQLLFACNILILLTDS